ncbi:MAG TPA: ATP-binding cassette domain-containing protein, partial [Paenalcaligenes sp.]|nr:ATP-binding cassette domain-containing protein [Paenalcaligenes sp.]
MIKGSQLSLRRGTKLLLDNANFTIHPGERVGIVGKNGAGKSTLFALLKHELEPDAGQLSMPESWRVASVEQEISDRLRPAREFVIDGDNRLRTIQQQRAQCTDDQGERIAELENAL